MGVIGPECLFPDGQCSLIQGLRLVVSTQSIIEKSKIVQAGCDIGMIGSERLFLYR